MAAPAPKPTPGPVRVENASCPRCGAPVLFNPELGLFCARPRCDGTRRLPAPNPRKESR